MRRWGLWLLALLGLPYALTLGYILLYSPPPPQPAEAVLVLGSRSLWHGAPNPCLVNRVREGVRLVQAGLAQYLVVSGGNDLEDGVNEARTMQQIAIGLGLLESQLVLEPNAHSTQENLAYTKAIAQQNRWQRLIVVSEPFHLPRAGRIAQTQGLHFSLSPAAVCHHRPLYYLTSLLREPFALLYYTLRGWG